MSAVDCIIPLRFLASYLPGVPLLSGISLLCTGLVQYLNWYILHHQASISLSRLAISLYVE